MDIEHDEQIGSLMAVRLKQAREAAGLTQVQVAEKTGINRNSIINYEKPTAPAYRNFANIGMEARNLRTLANLYNVSTDYLLGLTDTRSRSADIQTACKVTGLSEDSIKMLRSFKNQDFPYPGDYALDLVNEFISFSLDRHDGLHCFADDYLKFRECVNKHNEWCTSWNQMSLIEKEHDSSRRLRTFVEAEKASWEAFTPADAAKCYLAELCEDFKQYLKNKHPLEVAKNGND